MFSIILQVVLMSVTVLNQALQRALTYSARCSPALSTFRCLFKSLPWVFSHQCFIKAYVGGKNLEQILHSIAILDKFDDTRIDLVSDICDTLFPDIVMVY